MGEYVLKEHVKDVLALYDCRDRDLIKAINEMPIANVQLVDMKPIEHGHWVSLTDCANAGVYCSVCHKNVWREDYSMCNRKNKVRSNFCPHCGATMGEKEAVYD